MRRIIHLALGAVLTTAAVAAAAASAEASSASLRGSRAAMEQQNRVAKDHALDFFRTAPEIHAAVTRGDLVELAGNADYEVADFVRYPYAHPAAVLFVERLSAQYRDACGQKLVVTSAVRPQERQPRNAHALSVHPAGMALDLRVSDRAECRSWLESTLLNLESRGVLNGIREFHPPHYHVAVFPGPYLAYAEERMREEAEALAAAAALGAPADVAAATGAAVLTAGVVSELLDAPARRRSGVVAAAVFLAVLAVPLGGGVLIGRRRA
jgi:hypothetical protein